MLSHLEGRQGHSYALLEPSGATRGPRNARWRLKALRENFTPLQATAFCIFVLLYIPCMVAVAAQRHEYGTKWTLFSAAYLTGLGWVVLILVYQGGSSWNSSTLSWRNQD